MIEAFSKDYVEARGKFRDVAAAFGGHVDIIPHPLAGPDGGDLSMDVGFFGDPDARHVLVVSCGVHGPEGFYGSAAMTHALQTGLLKERGVRAVFVHACNPYGFAHVHRFTEDNVDLNRNFWLPGEAIGDDDAYRQVQAWGEIGGLSDEHIEAADRIGAEIAGRIGIERMKMALGAGQGCSETGLFYVGKGATWSRLAMERAFAWALANTDSAVYVDLHTGLGPEGFADILMAHPSGSEEHQAIVDHISPVAANQKRDEATGQDIGGSTEEGFKRTAQAMGARALAMAIECGTRDLDAVLDALRMDQALHVHGGREHPRYEDIKRQVRDAFYVETDSWKTAVLEQTTDILEGSLRYLERDGA